jgi:hypothetical protein
MDISSLVWGVLIGIAATVATGFGRAAGKDLYRYLKTKFGPPAPLKVGEGFEPADLERGSCAWVREDHLDGHESLGSTYYKHPNNRGGKCYREVFIGPRATKEFLMVLKQETMGMGH